MLNLFRRKPSPQDRLAALVEQARQANTAYRIQRDKSLSPARKEHINRVLQGYVRPRGGVA